MAILLRLDRIFVFIIINLIFLISSIVSIFLFKNQAQKITSDSTFYVESAYLKNKYLFSLEDAGYLKNAENIVSYENIDFGYVNFNNKTKIVQTNENYPNIFNLDFYEGEFFKGDSLNKAVINDVLAWKLFGNINALNQNIYIDGLTYEVCGITRDNKNSEPLVFLYLDPNLEDQLIDRIFVKSLNYKIPKSFFEIKNSLSKLNKVANIIDLNQNIKSFDDKIKLISAAFIMLIVFYCNYILIRVAFFKNSRIKYLLIVFLIFIIFAALNALNLNFVYPDYFGDGIIANIFGIFNLQNYSFKNIDLNNYLLLLKKYNLYSNISFFMTIIFAFNILFFASNIIGKENFQSF